MDKPHKKVVTTSPVAIKSGQTRVHTPNDDGPWHAPAQNIKCPNCETVYIVTSGFSKEDFLAALDRHHKNKEEHPDYIPSAPEWTSIEVCDCDSPQS